MPRNDEFRIVPFAPAHRAAVLDVVHTVYDEYRFTWNDSPYFADLHDPIGQYCAKGGMFWTMLDGDQPIGCVGATAHGPDCELHRLYLNPAYRGQKLGARLLNVVVEWARRRGFSRVVLWSDVLLTHAHALYKAHGFTQRGERFADDPDRSREYGFCLDLSPAGSPRADG